MKTYRQLQGAIYWLDTYQRITHEKEANNTSRNIIMFLVYTMIMIMVSFW